jgi:hypothetical protein
MSIITWDDKEKVRNTDGIPRKQQITAEDINDMKGAINNLWDNSYPASISESTTLTVEDSGQVFITDINGTLLQNDSANIIDSTKNGVQSGFGNYDVSGSFFDISAITKPCQIFINHSFTPAGNADSGVAYAFFSDKSNIPSSFVKVEQNGFNRTRNSFDNGGTKMIHYDPNVQPLEAIQIYALSQATESVTLKYFTIFINTLKQ